MGLPRNIAGSWSSRTPRMAWGRADVELFPPEQASGPGHPAQHYAVAITVEHSVPLGSQRVPYRPNKYPQSITHGKANTQIKKNVAMPLG